MIAEPTVAPDAVRQAVAACHEPFESACNDVAEALSSAFVERVRAGVVRHDEAIETLGLNGAPPRDWIERAEKLLEYRRIVCSELLEPLAGAFEGGGAAATLGASMTAAMERATGLCRALPATVEGTWAGDALAPHESDGRARRLGKAVARVVSVARKAGRPRQVPLRAAAARHLVESLAPGMDVEVVDAMGAWGDWTRELELAWLGWGDTVLPVLVRSEEPADDDGADAWATVRDAAAELSARLTTLADEAPLVATEVLDHLRAARAHLEADLAVAGSFLLDSAAPTKAPGLRRVSRAGAALQQWDDGVEGRLRMYLALLSILAGATAVQRRLVWRFRERCLSDMGVFPTTADRLEELARELERGGLGGGLADRLARVEEAVSEKLAPALGALPAASLVEATVAEGGDSTVEALLAMVRQAPVALPLHADNARLPSGARTADTRPVQLQELARQSFDALRIERIRSSTAGLIAAVEEVRADVSELPEVFSFAFEAAQGELAEGLEGADERAVGLVGEALRSMSESLRNEARELETAVEAAQRRLANEVCSGSHALLDRLAAGRMAASLLAARSRVAGMRAWINETWGPPVDRAAGALARWWKVLRLTVAKGLRAGSAMVGAPTTDATSSRSVRTLAEADVRAERLPLVYQRLFTLDPVTEPTLLAGRSSELAEGLKSWRSWKKGDGVPVIVRGRQGSGITSLLNVLGGEIDSAGGRRVSLSLDERLTDEASLAEVLCGGLGLPPVSDLDSVASAIFDAERGSLPDAVTVDNLEHAYVRVPKGTNVIERLLTLMAETEPRIFWIGGITTSAWQLVAAIEPTAISQVDLLALEPLGPAAIREAVTIRHRRSGLPVRFQEPPSTHIALKRRLRRIRDEAAYQEFLEEEFFENLNRASHGYVRLALFQWLMAADFDSGEGVLMSPPERPDFAVLDSLDLIQNFTLKAFLEHRTLTLAEHDAIIRIPRHESYQIFESLRNRHLIEPVPSAEEDQAIRSEIEESLRYRVRPLLVGAVVSHLQARNIVH